jgi:hypothetical protein
MKRFLHIVAPLLVVICVACESSTYTPPKSDSGVAKATLQVPVGTDGLTVEQRNVRDRVTADNKPGSIKHLYIISAYSGQVLIYSTVRGKVTSSGKRLNPRTVVGGHYGDSSNYYGIPVNIGGVGFVTTEVLEDDGTYGDSVPYVYWFDSKGAYHQQYIEGGMIVHVSDQPVAVKSIVLNMEAVIGPVTVAPEK